MGLIDRIQAAGASLVHSLRAPAKTVVGTGAGVFDSLMGAIDRRVPWSEQVRFSPGRGLNLAVIASALESADQGYMADFTDLSDEAMSMDPAFCSVMQRRIGQLLRLPWTVEPACGEGIDMTKSKEIASAIRHGLENWPGGFYRLRVDMSWALYHGRASSQLQWEREPISEGRPLEWMVVDSQWVHPRRLSFGERRELRVIDSPSGGLWQAGFASEGIDTEDPTSAGRFVSWKPRMFNDYPEREGLARRATYHMFFKRTSSRERMVLAELYGKPFKVLETEVGSAVDVPGAKNALEAIEGLGIRTNAIRLPVGMKLNIPWPDAAAGTIHQTTIDGVNAELEKLVLGTTMTTSIGPNGARSQAEVGERQQDVILSLDADQESSLYQDKLVRIMFALNYPGVPIAYCPRFRTLANEPADRDAKVNRAVVMARDLGVPIATEQLYEVGGFRRPREDEQVLVVIGGTAGAPKLFDTAKEADEAAKAAHEAEEKAKQDEQKRAGEMHGATVEQTAAQVEKTRAEAAAVGAKKVAASSRLLWDPNQPRDDDGKWTDGGGGSGGGSKESKWIGKAVETFGVTKNPKSAGYLLPDGRMLDFSEGSDDGSRIADHRTISQTLEHGDPMRKEYSAGMLGFMKAGGIRMSTPDPRGMVTFDLHADTKPTPEQMKAMQKLADGAKEVSIDLTRDDGQAHGLIFQDRPMRRVDSEGDHGTMDFVRSKREIPEVADMLAEIRRDAASLGKKMPGASPSWSGSSRAFAQAPDASRALFAGLGLKEPTDETMASWNAAQKADDDAMEMAGAALAPKLEPARVDALRDAVAHAAVTRPDGFSVREAGALPPGGFMVSRPPEEPGRSFIVEGGQTEAEVAKLLDAWIDQTAPYVLANPSMHYGGWKGPDGRFYLDVSENIQDGERAVYEAGQRNQLGIFSVTEERVIETGGTGERRGSK